VLIDRETEYLSIENYYGLSRTFCKEFRQQLATGARGRLLWTGRPVLISDASLLPELAEELQLEHSFASCLCVQISVHHQTLGYLFADSEKADNFLQEDIPIFQTFGRVAGVSLYQHHLYEENLRLDRKDGETALERYSFFSETLQQNLLRAREAGESLGLLMLDIDNYKYIANTFGSAVRLSFLREFAGLVRKHLRLYDSACRYGADEVLILFPNSDQAAVIDVAERICSVIREHTFTEHDIRTTVSAGIAVYPDDAQTLEELLVAVKQAVFDAQRSGRDRLHWKGIQS